ncbi:MAG TPA: radical SAM protein [Magnetospirillaceae bacterium]|nr:radical SAM protein [Magnetospirillaceae bacterium]
MFRPDQVIFAPTSKCNLDCRHCRVRRRPEDLSAVDAVAFLERCARGGIERVGFSGGEPFMRTDFLVEVSRTAVGLDLYFDRLMTNGVWFEDKDYLISVLGSLLAAGFDGTFGLSADAWHGQDPERLAVFLSEVFRIWGRRDCAEILSVRSPDDGLWIEGVETLANLLDGRLITSDGEPVAITDASPMGEEAAAGETLSIPILRFPRSASGDENAWGSLRWFREDFCDGPGNVFYVHPDGSVSVCCGYGNENASLIVGDVRDDDFDSLMRTATANPHVRLCYEQGLEARRRELEAAGVRFPGKTDDPCFFCDYLFRNGLIEYAARPG